MLADVARRNGATVGSFFFYWSATPLGQQPLGVLPVVYRIWAFAGMVQLEDWFRSWVLDSVFCAGGGRDCT